MSKVSEWAEKVKTSVRKVFFGSDDVVDKVLVALLCRGHVLIEDVPGVGKTILGRAVALSVGGDFNQIQCTPDLLPSDVLGVSVYNQKTMEFQFRPGPVITNILLVDEISRATPRTQSALLEAMAEGQVSIEGKSTPLPDPFFLIATESPVESEGTFPLPEVQKDRFFLSLSVGYPDKEFEQAIMNMQKSFVHPVSQVKPVTDLDEVRAMQQAILEVHVDETLRKYILSIVQASRIEDRFHLGVSPRGSLAMYKGCQALAALQGRDYVVPEDIQELAVPVLRKRILIKSEFSAKGVTEVQAVNELIEKIEVPPLKDAV